MTDWSLAKVILQYGCVTNSHILHDMIFSVSHRSSTGKTQRKQKAEKRGGETGRFGMLLLICNSSSDYHHVNDCAE